nr:MAG TPA: hypothetical protein [Caudoviricetes sp.]
MSVTSPAFVRNKKEGCCPILWTAALFSLLVTCVSYVLVIC